MKLAARVGALFFASALGCLVAGELVCRVFVREAPPLRFEQDLTELESAGRTDVEELFEPDPDLFWRLAPSKQAPADAPVFRGRISNRAGLREEHEIASPKPPGELRVLFLGDSCTFGSGLLLEEGYVQRVEDLLAERLERPVECVNAGVPGWSSWQGFRAYEKLEPALEPDLVVFCFGWNDGSRWDGSSDAEHARFDEERRPPGILAASRLCALVWRELTPRPAVDGLKPRVPPPEYAALLTSLEHRARARGHGLLVLVWPLRENLERPARSSYQEVGLRLASTFEGGSLGVLDLVEPTRALGRAHRPEELFQDRVHGTALLNRELATPIADWIAARWGDSSEGPHASGAPSPEALRGR